MRLPLLPAVFIVAYCLCVPGFAEDPAPRAIAMEFSDLKQTVSHRFRETLAILAADFPAEHDGLVARIAELQASPLSENARLLGVFEALKAVREAYKGKVRFAPSADQAAIMALLADFHERVFRSEGAAVCGRFSVDGAGVLFDAGLSPAYADALDRQSAAFLRAVVDAIENPVHHGTIGKDDWSAVTEELLAAGASWAVVDAVAAGDPNDPGLCPSLAAFFRAIAVSPSAEGERARADFVQNVTGY